MVSTRSVPALGRASTCRSPRGSRCPAGRARPCLARRAGAAAPRSAYSMPPSPSLSVPTKPTTRPGERARRVEALRLGVVARCRRGRAPSTSGDGGVVDLAGHVCERARRRFESRSASVSLVDLHDRRQLRRVRDRVLDHPRVGDDRRLRHRHREHRAVAVEDAAALGGERDGADALPEPERHEVRAVARLEVEEPNADGGEGEHASTTSIATRRSRIGGERRGAGSRARTASSSAGVPARHERRCVARRGVPRAAAGRRTGRARSGTADRRPTGPAHVTAHRGARLHFVFDQSAIVVDVMPSPASGIGASGTSRYSGARRGSRVRAARPPG